MSKIKFLDLGEQPIANGFLKESDLNKDEYTFNLSVGICSKTFLVSLMDFVDPPKMFNENYPFHTSASPVMESHFKRTSARKAEVDISVETNPYLIRILVNSEYILKLNLKLSNLLLKSQTGQKLSEKETSELLDIQNELDSFLKSRNVSKERDLEFFRKIGQSNIK